MNARKPSGDPALGEEGSGATLSSMLADSSLPPTRLSSTAGRSLSLQEIAKSPAVIYVYPRTSSPFEASPDDWDLIPGAKGCTAESCAFRDSRSELRASGYDIFGISAQTTEYQREASRRLHLNFELLADPELQLAAELGLPTFKAGPLTLYRRITLLVRDGQVQKVFYPIAVPEHHPDEVLRWIIRQDGATMSNEFDGH